MMPSVLSSSGYFGETEDSVFENRLRLWAQREISRRAGQCRYEPGQVKNTYGTGGFLLMNTGRTGILL